jgi:hypothetical protein
MIPRALAQAVDRFTRAAIGLQKRREKDAIAAKHEPAFRDFFERQGHTVLFRFMFMEEFFRQPEPVRMMEAKRPVNTEALKRWDDIWQSVEQETTDTLQRLVTGTEAEGMQKGADQLRGQLGLFDPKQSFSLANPRAVAWFRKNGGSVDYIKGIQETTGGSLKTVITTALDEGWSYDDTAEEIKKLFDGPISTDRARLIAVNESAQSYEAGNRAFADSIADDGIVMEKRWTTSHDNRVSDGCEENEGDGWIPIDEPHTSGHQEPPRFPGCRCFEQYRQARV